MTLTAAPTLPVPDDTSASAQPVSGVPGRLRRLRGSPQMRRLVRETRLSAAQLIAPLFVVDGAKRREPLGAVPGQARMSPDLVVDEARRLSTLGVGGVLLFGVIEAARKDPLGAAAADPKGPVPVAIRAMREAGLPIVVAADVCLCAYTTHGHCGLLDGHSITNGGSLAPLAEAAVAYARAGADVVAPSAMMDGQVAAIRAALDLDGRVETAILAYASKHASALYGPFREAANSVPAFGDRRSYQMDPANGREAMRELAADAVEGADMLMVKPAITSLDLLARAREAFDRPLAAYQVSGELAMLEAAAERGWLDRRRAGLELLTAIARAGADVVITYLAADAAGWLADGDPR